LVRITGAFVEETPRGRKLVDREQALSAGKSKADLPAPWSSDAPLELEPSLWRAYWDLSGTAFVVSKKYRFGASWEPAHALEELSAPGVLDADRKLAALEYDLRPVGSTSLPDTNDWVMRQIDALRFAMKGR
jgi:hypothetical protein